MMLSNRLTDYGDIQNNHKNVVSRQESNTITLGMVSSNENEET